VLISRLANDVRRNGRRSSGTDDDRVLRVCSAGTVLQRYPCYTNLSCHSFLWSRPGLFGPVITLNTTVFDFYMQSFKVSTTGSDAFPVVAAKVWNAQPDNVVSASLFELFGCLSKSFHF